MGHQPRNLAEISFPWDKLYKLPNVSVLRSMNNGQIQSRSVTSNHESDGSVLECIYSPGLSSSQASIFSPSSFGGVMIARSVAAPMPFAGPPLQCTILRLSAILHIIDGKMQNVEGMASLRSQLDRLSNRLRNAPTTEDPVEQAHRDSLDKMLRRTIDKLLQIKIVAGQGVKLQDTPRVTQAINGCHNSINVYLLDCALLPKARIQRRVNEMFAAVMNMQSPEVNIMKTAMLVDAAGHEWPIPLYCCTSYEQLHAMLAVLFESDSSEAKLQRRLLLLPGWWYDLYIDHDTNITKLTPENCTTIEPGTTIVMRAIIPQQCGKIPTAKTVRKNNKRGKVTAKNTSISEMESICNFQVELFDHEELEPFIRLVEFYMDMNDIIEFCTELAFKTFMRDAAF